MRTWHLGYKDSTSRLWGKVVHPLGLREQGQCPHRGRLYGDRLSGCSRCQSVTSRPQNSGFCLQILITRNDNLDVPWCL